MPTRVTIVDVARESGVSIGTVYRAVSNSGRISPKTRARVLETVERLGYRANTVARGLALRSKFHILVIMPRSPGNFWDGVRKGARKAEAELSEFGVKVTHFDHCAGLCAGRGIREVLAGQRFDAFAMTGTGFPDAETVLGYALDNRIPVALFNEETERPGRLFYYGPDNRLAGRLAAEIMRKFIPAGGECLTVLGAEGESYTGEVRYRSFREAMEAHGRRLRCGGPVRCAPDGAAEAVRRVLRERPGAAGIYFAEYEQLRESLGALADAGRGLAVVGHEYHADFGEALRRGTLSALLVQEKSCQGYYPVMMLYRHLVTAEKPERDVYYSNINVILEANAGCLGYGSDGCGYE